MMKRVKLVTMMSRPGATDSTVSSPNIWMMVATVVPLAWPMPPRSICWALAAVAVAAKTVRKTRSFFIRTTAS